jgi:hypothetical protein
MALITAEYRFGQDCLLLLDTGTLDNFIVVVPSWLYRSLGDDRYEVRETSQPVAFDILDPRENA